jgi:hypothetical protein
MLSVEIKINDTTLKKFIAVRRWEFAGHGATHEYDAEMVVEDHIGEITLHRDRYPMGRIKHRYCAGAVSLAEKMLKLAREKGMHR